jgi:hypothetical protein
MPAIPSLVDQFGNLNIHMEQDLVLPLRGGSNVGDLSARTLVFLIPARGIKHTPIANPVDPTGRIIKILAKDLKNVRSGDSFILLDRTGGGSKPRWEGTITRRS